MSVDPRLRAIRSFPGLAVAGFAVMVLGLLLDLVVHVLLPGHLHDAFSSHEHTAHLVVFVGMVLTLGGIVFHGLRRRARSRSLAAEKEHSDASR